MLLVHLFVCFARECLCPFSSWCRGLAAVCDCGMPWTFLLTCFRMFYVFKNSLDQFLDACSRELFVHLKPKAFENLDAMAKEADLFAEACGGVFSCVNKGRTSNEFL